MTVPTLDQSRIRNAAAGSAVRRSISDEFLRSILSMSAVEQLPRRDDQPGSEVLIEEKLHTYDASR